MKILIVLFLFLSNLINAQVLDVYPENQVFYQGGYDQFYKDAHQYLVNNNITPCENKTEVYLMKVLIGVDGKVMYVQDPDEKGVMNNKCTFDLGKKILSNLKNYTPAEVDGKKAPALSRIVFYPNELFSSGDYMPNFDFMTDPEFPGGIANYRKKFISCFDTNGYSYSQTFRFVINFEVDTQGDIQNIFIDTEFDNDQFVKMIVDCVVPKKIKFKPGSYRGTPITRSFRLPITINVE